MKRIVLLLVLLLISSNAYTEARVIRTYRPIPYNRGFNPFVRPSSSYFGVGRYNFNNGYYGNYYNRYSNYNNNWRNSRYYYPTRYYNNNYPRPTYNNYYRPQNVNAFDKFHNLNRSIHRYNSSPTRVYRLNRSDIASNIKPVSYTTNANQKDPRLSLVFAFNQPFRILYQFVQRNLPEGFPVAFRTCPAAPEGLLFLYAEIPAGNTKNGGPHRYQPAQSEQGAYSKGFSGRQQGQCGFRPFVFGCHPAYR